MSNSPPLLPPDKSAWIARKLAGMMFGTITIHIHGGKIVQVDKTEKEKAEA